jgi:hypothetical protein
VVHPLPQREESGLVAFTGVVVLDVYHASLRLWKQINLFLIPVSPIIAQNIPGSKEWGRSLGS